MEDDFQLNMTFLNYLCKCYDCGDLPNEWYGGGPISRYRHHPNLAPIHRNHSSHPASYKYHDNDFHHHMYPHCDYVLEVDSNSMSLYLHHQYCQAYTNYLHQRQTYLLSSALSRRHDHAAGRGVGVFASR